MEENNNNKTPSFRKALHFITWVVLPLDKIFSLPISLKQDAVIQNKTKLTSKSEHIREQLHILKGCSPNSSPCWYLNISSLTTLNF